jgi:hypothetical protein
MGAEGTYHQRSIVGNPGPAEIASVNNRRSLWPQSESEMYEEPDSNERNHHRVLCLWRPHQRSVASGRERFVPRLLQATLSDRDAGDSGLSRLARTPTESPAARACRLRNAELPLRAPNATTAAIPASAHPPTSPSRQNASPCCPAVGISNRETPARKSSSTRARRSVHLRPVPPTAATRHP